MRPSQYNGIIQCVTQTSTRATNVEAIANFCDAETLGRKIRSFFLRNYFKETALVITEQERPVPGDCRSIVTQR